MPFADIKAATVFHGFSAADQTSILAAMQTAYDGSAAAKKMFDDWIATAGHTIDITFKAGAFQAFLSTGRVELDPAMLTNASYIDPNGTAVKDTMVTALVHELGHGLSGFRDNWTAAADYKGDNVKFVNTMYKELGLPEQISYIAYDSTGNVLKLGTKYTNGAAIDAAHSGNQNWSSAALGNSKDLLISGASANTLESGAGNDFLFGAGGNDTLDGGADKDTAVFSGTALDYDVRQNRDGSWTVRHARGAKDEGTDTLKNVEVVQFKDGTSYELKKNGLGFQTDFAMVIDTTGSMGSSISSVKTQATALLNAAFANGKADARIGVVGFKDTTNGEPSSVILRFTDQDDFAARRTAATAAINGISVSGGGDTPETPFDGLRVALNGSMGDWRVGAGVQRIALFTDAPAKDGALASVVTNLAKGIGGRVDESASFRGIGGSIDTFKIVFDAGVVGDGNSGDDGMVLDFQGRSGEGDPGAPADPPFVSGGGAITGTPATTEVQIFSINTGSSSTDMSALSSIAGANGGKLLSAASGDDLVKALVGIIDGTVSSGDTINGTANPDTLTGGARNDTIGGLAADDVITGGGGDDKIDGGTGTDTSKYSGAAKGYKISFTAGGTSVTVQDKLGSDGTDTLTNVERIQFSDGTIETAWLTKTASLSSSQLVGLTQLYIASFNRAPDAGGLQYWGSQFKDGMSLQDIAKSFFVQPETIAAYPAGQSTTDFVSKVYNNVLGRTPDAGGLAYWVGQLQTGSVAKDAFLLAIINGAFPPSGSAVDAQYLTNKTTVGIHYALTEGLSDVGHARTVMAGVTSSSTSVSAANSLVDGFATSAAGGASSELVMQIVGIVV